ncbi:MAG: hypothetical protein AAGK14_09865 [Verrucomicrobiota bacterium]
MHWRQPALGVALLTAWLSVAPALWSMPDALKEKGVLYFDDNLPSPLDVTMAKAAYLHADRSLNTPRIALAKDHPVRLVGMAPEGFYIRGTSTGGRPAEGWVGADVIAVDPQILEQAQAQQQQRDRIKEAIAAKQVIEGMTLDDVQAALGKPETISFRQENGQRIDTWRYITYERVPETQTSVNSFGQLVNRTVYVRRAVGTLTVDFREGIVRGLERHTQTNIRGRPNPTIPSVNP